MAELSPVVVKVRADTSEFMDDIRGAEAALDDADFPRAEVLWLVKRLERSEYERVQLKATNRRLLRRLRNLRHKRGHK
jgi:hypothetical protein